MIESSTKLHPQARSILKRLRILKEEHPITHIDFSNSTNPFGGPYTDYPTNTYNELKEIYLQTMLDVEKLRFPSVQWPPLSPNNILFSVGSVDGLDIVLKGFCESHQDTIGIMQPSFSAYDHFAKMFSLKAVPLPLTGDDLSQLDVSLIQQIHPKMVILCTPNNPTGTELAPGLIAKICESYPGIVLVDEAYHEYGTQPSSIQYILDYKNLIVLRTLSKAWGMAGLRCGAIIADSLIIDTLKYVQTPFPLTSPAIEEIKKLLLNTREFVTSWEVIKQERDTLMDTLKSLPYVTKVYPSHSNFVFFTVQDANALLAHLDRNGLYVVDASKFMPNAIKISINHPRNNQTLIKALQEFHMTEQQPLHHHSGI